MSFYWEMMGDGFYQSTIEDFLSSAFYFYDF